MAVTSLWRVKGYIGKVLLYAENPEKTINPTTLQVNKELNRDTLEDVISYTSREEATNQQQLVWGINCVAETARKEMIDVKKQFAKEDGTIAYHGYQSFKDHEVTPELAHKIGINLAEELWGDRYQVLVATHLDKDSHIHNHFVINTVSFKDGQKFYRSNNDYKRMQDVSDRLCREHGLSVIEKPQGKRKNHSEWSAEKNGKPTHRGMIRADIDKAISASVTERDFYDLLSSWGYEFKFYGKDGQELKRPSLRPRGGDRFYRFDRLGEDYSVDEISFRILENIVEKDPFPWSDRDAYLKYRSGMAVDRSLRGISAVFFRYTLELHIIKKFPYSMRMLPAVIREDLRKLDNLDRQTRFLAANKIESVADMNRFRDESKIQLEEHQAIRADLRNRLKREIRVGDNEAILSVKKQIAGVTEQMSEIRGSLNLCDVIEKRSEQIRERTEMIQNLQTEGKENVNELLKRGGRTGREDVLKRS